MKPSDFFLGIRQLLGVLVPGILWIIAIAIGIARVDLVDTADELGIARLAMLLVAAYGIGLLLRGFAFRMGVIAGELAHTGVTRIARALLSIPGASELVSVSHERLGSMLLVSFPADPEGRAVAAWAHDALGKRLGSATGKQFEDLNRDAKDRVAQAFLLGSERNGRKVEENEAEVGFYAGLFAPLGTVLAALIVSWSGPSPNASSFLGIANAAPLSIGILASMGVVAAKVRPRRIAEIRDVHYMVIAEMALCAKNDGRESEGSLRVRS